MTGRREVSEPIAEVSRADLWLHDGLVQSLAKRRADRRVVTLSQSVQHRQRGRDQETAHRDDGNCSWRRRRKLCYLLPEVTRSCSSWLMFVIHRQTDRQIAEIRGLRVMCKKSSSTSKLKTANYHFNVSVCCNVMKTNCSSVITCWLAGNFPVYYSRWWQSRE